MFKEKFVVGSNDVDCFMHLKVSSLFMYFQDIATHAVEKVKLDYTELMKHNVDWVITSMNCEIYRIPNYLEEITIFTYPGKDMMFLYPRHFVVKDKKGNIIAKAASIWAIIDLDTRRLSNKRDLIKGLPSEHLDGELNLPRKNALGETSLLDTRKIYFSEIDLNGHMNNCSYVKLVVDAKNMDFYKDFEISKINLNYLKELKQGDEIQIYDDGNSPYGLEIKRNDEVCFTAVVEYKKR